MPVFISHRTSDNAIAKRVHTRLTQTHGITCYVDDVDQRLRTASERQLTDILVDMVNKCSNLLAVVTANTQGSWWVPFEIGVAKQAPRVICSMTDQADSALPEYLMEWPRLRGERAVDEFAALYKAQQRLLRENVMEKRAASSVQFATVESFHRSLKAALGQT